VPKYLSMFAKMELEKLSHSRKAQVAGWLLGQVVQDTNLVWDFIRCLDCDLASPFLAQAVSDLNWVEIEDDEQDMREDRSSD
jgi:hypothetical protein